MKLYLQSEINHSVKATSLYWNRLLGSPVHNRHWICLSGLTNFLRYVFSHFAKLLLNYSWYVSVRWWRIISVIFALCTNIHAYTSVVRVDIYITYFVHVFFSSLKEYFISTKHFIRPYSVTIAVTFSIYVRQFLLMDDSFYEIALQCWRYVETNSWKVCWCFNPLPSESCESSLNHTRYCLSLHVPVPHLRHPDVQAIEKMNADIQNYQRDLT